MKKDQIIAYFNSVALERDRWYKRNSYYHKQLKELVKFFVPVGCSILDIGSSTGELLDYLKPSRGVGVDLRDRMVDIAKLKFPGYKFINQDI